MKEARIKIEGDGTFKGTRVIDTLSGTMIPRISRMTLEAHSGDEELMATIELSPLNIELEAHIGKIRIGDTIYTASHKVQTWKPEWESLDLKWGATYKIDDPKIVSDASFYHPYPCPTCNPREYDESILNAKGG